MRRAKDLYLSFRLLPPTFAHDEFCSLALCHGPNWKTVWVVEVQQMSSIAVVIPIHNKQPHINRCLASVLSQTRPVDEIIVIDDASSDGSIGEIAQFTNERIRLLKRPVPSPGGYAARNLGILQAKSDWIAFLDADDARPLAVRHRSGSQEFGPLPTSEISCPLPDIAAQFETASTTLQTQHMQ